MFEGSEAVMERYDKNWRLEIGEETRLEAQAC